MKKQTSQPQNVDPKNAENIVAIGIDWGDQEHAFYQIDAEENESAGQFDQTPDAIDDWITERRQVGRFDRRGFAS